MKDYIQSDVDVLIEAAEELINRYPVYRDDPSADDIRAWDKLKDAVEQLKQ